MKHPTVYPSPETLCTAAADFWVAAYSAAIIARDSFHVAFSGGTTPKKLYEKLATPEYQSKINWHKVHIYFGDERFVPLDHDDSNFKMVNQALLINIDCPATNIHPVNVSLHSAEAAAKQYEKTLIQHLPSSNGPQFDLVMLGLGPDGHTASLFPDTDAVNETTKQCVAVYVKKMDSWRVSITFTAINNAHKILLLSEGSSKQEIIRAVTNNDEATTFLYPIQRVRQSDGFFWYADQAAVN